MHVVIGSSGIRRCEPNFYRSLAHYKCRNLEGSHHGAQDAAIDQQCDQSDCEDRPRDAKEVLHDNAIGRQPKASSASQHVGLVG